MGLELRRTRMSDTLLFVGDEGRSEFSEGESGRSGGSCAAVKGFVASAIRKARSCAVNGETDTYP